ncbi:hypothetical protein [Duffyella gerundensis]|uniref:hypothetical protein n=1 Tax=Duffyella gerundensis TaxID=1619313 RepID=UPI003FD4C200
MESSDIKIPCRNDGGFFAWILYKKEFNSRSNMKEKKTEQVTVKLTPTQKEFLDSLIETGKAKNLAASVQYLINIAMILK